MPGPVQDPLSGFFPSVGTTSAHSGRVADGLRGPCKASGLLSLLCIPILHPKLDSFFDAVQRFSCGLRHLLEIREFDFPGCLYVCLCSCLCGGSGEVGVLAFNAKGSTSNEGIYLGNSSRMYNGPPKGIEVGDFI